MLADGPVYDDVQNTGCNTVATYLQAGSCDAVGVKGQALLDDTEN